MLKWVLLLCVWRAAGLAKFLYQGKGLVNELNFNTFGAVMQGVVPKRTVVVFYAHWCGHCQRYVETYLRLADVCKAQGVDISFCALNCHGDDQGVTNTLCMAQEIKYFPSMKMFFPALGSNDVLAGSVPINLDPENFDGIISTVKGDSTAAVIDPNAVLKRSLRPTDAQHGGARTNGDPNSAAFESFTKLDLFGDVVRGIRDIALMGPVGVGGKLEGDELCDLRFVLAVAQEAFCPRTGFSKDAGGYCHLSEYLVTPLLQEARARPVQEFVVAVAAASTKKIGRSGKSTSDVSGPCVTFSCRLWRILHGVAFMAAGSRNFSYSRALSVTKGSDGVCAWYANNRYSVPNVLPAAVFSWVLVNRFLKCDECIHHFNAFYSDSATLSDPYAFALALIAQHNAVNALHNKPSWPADTTTCQGCNLPAVHALLADPSKHISARSKEMTSRKSEFSEFHSFAQSAFSLTGDEQFYSPAESGSSWYNEWWSLPLLCAVTITVIGLGFKFCLPWCKRQYLNSARSKCL